MTTAELWQEYKPRFEYWREWVERETGNVPKDIDWWRSRFSDDYPWYDHNGFNKQNFDLKDSFPNLWIYFLAPALDIDLGPVQLRMF